MRRIVLAVVLATFFVWSSAAAAKECKPVSGTFEATTVACAAPCHRPGRRPPSVQMYEVAVGSASESY